jgi:Ca2+-binding EF-hand superfamily protein
LRIIAARPIAPRFRVHPSPLGSGSIDASELGDALTLIGQGCSAEELAELIARYDADESGEIEEKEFLQLMAARVKGQSMTVEQVSDAFRVFDKDGGGSLDREELMEAIERGLAEMGDAHDITQAEIEDLLDDADEDGDGDYTFEEFSEFILSNKLRPEGDAERVKAERAARLLAEAEAEAEAEKKRIDEEEAKATAKAERLERRRSSQPNTAVNSPTGPTAPNDTKATGDNSASGAAAADASSDATPAAADATN